MRKLSLASIIAIIFSVVGCREVEVTPVRILPLYKQLEQFSVMDNLQRDSLMHAESAEIKLMMEFLGHDSISDRLIEDWSASNVVRMFSEPVDSVFPSLESLGNSLGLLLENAKSAELDIPDREYVAVVWSSMRSIVVSDSIVMIALNHFLGADFPGYITSKWPKYMNTTKTPEQ